jgi:hypothetical protein
MTRGVPRLKELLKVTPNIRASSLTIYLRPDLRTSKEAARKLAQELEFTMLKDLVTVSRIYFDPRDADTLIAEDKEWLSFFADFEQGEAKPGVVKSPWIMRLELNREKMFNKNITMEDVHFMIRKFNGEIDVTYSDHNASRLVFRVRLTASGKELDDLAVEESSWRVVSARQPGAEELEDLRFAWRLVRHVRSNAIVVAKAGQSLGVGAGQMNRVGSARLALEAAGERASGAVLASDGFFPFDDTVRLAASHGIAAVIQPGGSVRDEEVIAAADGHGIAMVFTGTRHFRH